jgi:hypothetical protein
MENLSNRCQISLNGYLEEEVYIEQPVGYEVKGHKNKVLKLNKVLHRLKQVTRA